MSGPIKRLHAGRVKEFRKLQQKRRWRRMKRKPGRRKFPRRKKARKPGVGDCYREIYCETLKREIARNAGHIAKIAWAMNIQRRVLYSWLYKWELWSLVNAARVARVVGETTVESAETELIKRTRLALR